MIGAGVSVWTKRGNAAGVVYDTDAQATFDALTTQLSPAVKLAISDLIAGWKTDGFWAVADGIALFDLPATDARALDWKTPSRSWTVGSGILYDGINGIQGDATANGVVFSGFSAAASIGNGDGAMFCHVTVADTTPNAWLMGYNSSRGFLRGGTSASAITARARLHASANLDSGGYITDDTYLCVTRSSLNQYFRVDGTEYTNAPTLATASTGENMDLYSVSSGGGYSISKIDFSGFANGYISKTIWDAAIATHAAYKTALAAAFA